MKHKSSAIIDLNASLNRFQEKMKKHLDYAEIYFTLYQAQKAKALTDALEAMIDALKEPRK